MQFRDQIGGSNIQESAGGKSKKEIGYRIDMADQKITEEDTSDSKQSGQEIKQYCFQDRESSMNQHSKIP